MNEYEKIREAIEIYLMKQFEYRRPLLYLTFDNVIASERNKDINLYLRLRRKESQFPSDCLIIARIGFCEERIGHGTDFIRLLTEIAVKYGFKHIGIEATNEKSSSLVEKLGFYSTDGSNYAVSVESLIAYFQDEN